MRVNGQEVDKYGLCDDTATEGWAQRNVDLSTYVNQNVTVQIRVETDGSVNSNLFVDDVFMQGNVQNSVPGENGRLGKLP